MTLRRGRRSTWHIRSAASIALAALSLAACDRQRPQPQETRETAPSPHSSALELRGDWANVALLELVRERRSLLGAMQSMWDAANPSDTIDPDRVPVLLLTISDAGDGVTMAYTTDLHAGDVVPLDSIDRSVSPPAVITRSDEGGVHPLRARETAGAIDTLTWERAPGDVTTFVRVIPSFEEAVDRLLVEGVYRAANGETVTFGDGRIERASDTALYAVGVDFLDVAEDYIAVWHESDPDAREYWPFEWNGSVLRFYRSSRTDSGFVRSGPPLLELTPLRDATPPHTRSSPR
jgi:hypothetical protein